VRVSDFDFDLPEDLIAQDPVPRGTSRMLMLERQSGRTEHASVADLPRFLRAGDVLVVNNTRVFAARLLGRRVPSGGAVECLLLSAPEVTADGAAVCDALVHPGQKLKPGAVIRFEDGHSSLRADVLERRFFGRRRLRLTAERGGTIEALVERLGHTPLPPYIRRPDAAADRERYQTVFAKVRGSVAAPTAGLHFTPGMIAALEAQGVEMAALTLHVGYGTFKPVRTDVVELHTVDPERYEIDAATAERLNKARREQRRIVAVGTTTTRAIEDAALRGGGRISAGAAEATAFIYPGFVFQIVDGLMTNFHVPRSTLLMLVCAFAGREHVLAAYREAVAHRYRFYSYGDAMLIV
jgi:S-adenosylmethionine:tRNA ribosyltransferase-isomerase